jgi:hypothetical protein
VVITFALLPGDPFRTTPKALRSFAPIHHHPPKCLLQVRCAFNQCQPHGFNSLAGSSTIHPLSNTYRPQNYRSSSKQTSSQPSRRAPQTPPSNKQRHPRTAPPVRRSPPTTPRYAQSTASSSTPLPVAPVPDEKKRSPVTPAVLRSIFASSRTPGEERSISRVAFFR